MGRALAERGRCGPEIVYELNGELHVLTTATGETRRIVIQVPDDGVASRPSRIPVSRNIEDFGLSPKGGRALFVARGDIFTAPIENRPTRNLTHSSNAHDKWARWSPDGGKIAFVSDRSGEEEIYLINQDGTGEPEQLTTGGQAMRYAPEWSPDGKRLAFMDKDGKLYVLTLEDKKLVEIADDMLRPRARDSAWSPNGGHLAFSLTGSNNLRSIYIWSVSDGQRRRITSELFDEFDPAWDPEGNYLYYLSRREFAPRESSVEWNYFIDREMGIFTLALRTDVRHPFLPESDEVTVEKEETEEKDKEYIKIDFDGLAERVVRVPVPPDNLGGLKATKEHLLYIRRAASYYGRDSDQPPSLQIFSMNDREVSTLAEKVNAYALCAFSANRWCTARSRWRPTRKRFWTSPCTDKNRCACQADLNLHPLRQWAPTYAWGTIATGIAVPLGVYRRGTFACRQIHLRRRDGCK